jgi:sec-independent protein translocase protein TatB
MFNIGAGELLVILLVALIVVGPQKLPEIGRTIGRALTEFRKTQDELRRSLDFFGSDDAGSTSTPATPAPEVRPSPPVVSEDDATETAVDEDGAEGDQLGPDAGAPGEGSDGEATPGESPTV